MPVVLHRAEPAVIGFKNGAGFGYALHRCTTIRAPGGGNLSGIEGPSARRRERRKQPVNLGGIELQRRGLIEQPGG